MKVLVITHRGNFIDVLRNDADLSEWANGMRNTDLVKPIEPHEKFVVNVDKTFNEIKLWGDNGLVNLKFKKVEL